MKKWIALFLTAALAPSAWTGCSASEQSGSAAQSLSAPSVGALPGSESTAVSPAGHYPVTVSNFNYAREPVEVTYEKAPKRVITSGPIRWRRCWRWAWAIASSARWA